MRATYQPEAAASRRQVLKTTALASLASWLPFGRMASSSAFELPGDKWWRSDTVAVVTGGTGNHIKHSHTSLTTTELA